MIELTEIKASQFDQYKHIIFAKILIEKKINCTVPLLQVVLVYSLINWHVWYNYSLKGRYTYGHHGVLMYTYNTCIRFSILHIKNTRGKITQKKIKKTLKPFLCDMLWFYDIVSVFYIPTYTNKEIMILKVLKQIDNEL